MPSDGRCVSNGEMSYENSGKLEPKRSHQWFVDGTAPQMFSNKRQAMETIGGRPVPDIASMSMPSWDNNANFHTIPGQFTDRLFGSEPIRPSNLVDRNMAPFNAGDITMGRKLTEDQFANDSSVNLSMSHSNEDPSSFLNFGGHRKVKINQVREPDSSISASMGNSFRRADNSGISYKTDGNTISLGPAYENRDQNNNSLGTGYSKASENFIPMSQTFGKEDGNFISMGQNYNKGTENLLSMAQPFGKGDGSFISMGQAYRKGDTNNVSTGMSYNKEQSNFISMGHNYGKPGENLMSMAPSFNKGNDSLISMGHTYHKADANIGQMGATYEKGDSRILSMGHSYKGDHNTISFGGFSDEPEGNASGTIIGNYEIVIDNEGSAQGSEMPCLKEVIESNLDQAVNSCTASKANSRTDNPPKTKAVKKVPANNFPSNVKSLLSTGLLDGVPVKYVSWSREKNLKAVIRGTGYLCGCNECNHSKSLNAYEFERHAGCKTKHPNNHIYFENGKTIYAVVQELKNTPQEMLFDVIQNITGSPINQKNFRIWKASYQAAARELQRIYGKDEVKMPC
ncbi:hypothetical protein CRG98_007278 [Punica granatum]|uniref:Tify domain-containing protein n=2 Tax=Punica granatum TaxID=22663 RepID=A0A2I0KVA3_PUNGR|nr:hypothetical protein CRG98_007278 [Punica granatum]